MAISIVYDNYLQNPSLTAAWGFACLVNCGGHFLLFDTGGDAATLLGNMGLLGLDPQQIEAVVLSHCHGDHTGGLAGLLGQVHDLTIYVLSSFPARFREQVRDAGAELVEVGEPMEIMPGVCSTGELGDGIREQALALESTEGLAIITGCAHPGIVRVVERAKAICAGRHVYLILGGFHLGSQSGNEIERVISEFRRLGVERVAPCHCSGDRARDMFAAEYGEDCILTGVGWGMAISR